MRYLVCDVNNYISPANYRYGSHTVNLLTAHSWISSSLLRFEFSVADLEGAEPASAPFWATDRRRDSRSCQLMLNFDRSTAKHGTQNIQNDCHQWLSDSFRVHRIRFRPGLRLGPHWGAYSAPPDPSSGFKALLRPPASWILCFLFLLNCHYMIYILSLIHIWRCRRRG